MNSITVLYEVQQSGISNFKRYLYTNKGVFLDSGFPYPTLQELNDDLTVKPDGLHISYKEYEQFNSTNVVNLTNTLDEGTYFKLRVTTRPSYKRQGKVFKGTIRKYKTDNGYLSTYTDNINYGDRIINYTH